jgi:hypothetical protein
MTKSLFPRHCGLGPEEPIRRITRQSQSPRWGFFNNPSGAFFIEFQIFLKLSALSIMTIGKKTGLERQDVENVLFIFGK